MEITIVKRPALRFAALAHHGAYTGIGPLFARLAALCPPEGPMEALYHDDPDTVAEEALRAHACTRLSAGRAVPDGCEEVSLPAGRDLVYLHTGPYQGLREVYQRLFQDVLPQQGLTPAALPAREVYLNTAGQVPERDLRTEIHVAVI
ncbi:DNA gyrase inhibitor GyrI [Rubricella aquisinus]|uniref:DNA gyrase inhibitor GyrI n=1 Tax=Rubricella aquisinus TaxID=2028108 RepID=A0A840WLR1_9RHOB|nr:GyrI-like domain-containing protein [Rubricella aquisinus]MBB5516028.1 DNA gyrase inhibitor GyrI [Rubricella aquisinus]